MNNTTKPPRNKSSASGSNAQLEQGSLTSSIESSNNDNTDIGTLLRKEKQKNTKLKDKLKVNREELKNEKERKNKLYKGLVKLASELKDSQSKIHELQLLRHGEERNWYDGGMWRAPELLPGIQTQQRKLQHRGEEIEPTASSSMSLKKEAVSLSDLFFDLVIVTAFTRVGLAIQDNGELKLPQFFYFCIFWLIWGKEASFSTRFDTADLSSQMETLFTCFAVLFGSLGSKSDFQSNECTSVMIVALFVALLHFLLHLRVWYWFRDVNAASELISVKAYAKYVMLLTGLESITWIIGIYFLEQDSKWRVIVFLVAVLLSFRIPRSFLPNDFHAACSKRGVLFILTLGFILQSIVLIASPFFDYQTPNMKQFVFLGLPCFLLFCIKLLYVDDSFSVDPKDHALLVNRAAGFFFHTGQLALLLSTTILGGGLNLLTHSYLAGTAALANDSKSLVCGGFSGVILSIGFIKSMHIRRFPTNPSHRQLFFAAYGTQILVLLAVSYTTISLCLNKPGYLGQVALNEIQLLVVLCLLSLFLLVISWLDEAVELNLYGESDAAEFRVHPFGLWTCLKSGDPKPPIIRDTNTIADRRLSHISPLLTNSNANLFDSQIEVGDNERSYGTAGSGLGSGEEVERDGERTRLVKFVDDNEDEENVKRLDVVV